MKKVATSKTLESKVAKRTSAEAFEEAKEEVGSSFQTGSIKEKRKYKVESVTT